MMRLNWLALAGAAVLLAGNASAQQATPPAPPARDFSKVEIKTTDLGNDTYMLEGEGGNITIAVGKDGIIMVDGEFAPLHDKIKAAIEAVSRSRSSFWSTRIFTATTRAETRPSPRTAPSSGAAKRQEAP